jgi:GNAT superfamily N-acetyltransferase
MVEYHPATPERWPDLERLFGPRGACGGCWCMWWRLPRAAFEQGKGEQHRDAFRALVESGEVPGLLAYERGAPIGWCALAPRADYPRLDSSRLLKPIDDLPVWSVVCFFVARGHRRQGMSVGLLRAAVAFATQRGAQIVEGYPIEPRSTAVPAPFAYTGTVSAFRQAGFVEVLRRSETRPIMRYTIGAAG